MDTSLTAALGVGFLLGLRHATDADHIAAVSTFVSQDRSLVRSCLVGTFWGAGHTVALFVAGLATITFRLTISPAMERTFEMLVALVLILLGGHALLQLLAPTQLPHYEHAHDGAPHRHLHVHLSRSTVHAHAHLLTAARRPFLVGLLHGVAGSAALMLLVLSTLPSPLAGLLYIVVFGAGATAGMLVLSGLIAVPFFVTADRSRTLQTAIRATAGAGSLVLGVWLVGRLRGG